MFDNNKAFAEKLDRFCVKVEDHIGVVCSKIATRVVDYIERNRGDKNIMPVITGNLSDSTGIGVYVNGVLRKYIPIQYATEPRNITPNAPFYQPVGSYDDREYWGTEELNKALELAATTYSKDVWIVAFSTMPYSFSPNGRSESWFYDNTVEFMVEEVLRSFKEMQNVKMK